jgi:tol-pal system protein YbgF
MISIRRLGWLVSALCLFTVYACAHRQVAPQHQTDLAPLEKQLAETDKKLETMTQRVAVLQLMVDTQQRTIQDLKGALGTATPAVSKPSPAAGTVIEEPLPAQKTKQQPSALPAAPTVPPPPKPKAVAEKPAAPGPAKPSPKAEALYKEALSLYRKGDFKAALERFSTFAARYPNENLADNALYWAGECRYSLKDFGKAVHIFRSILKRYPSGNKVPDALLKIGFSYSALGDKQNAKAYLKKLITNYPFHPAAAKAEEKLKQLK